MAPFAGAAVTVPALYMAGERDFVAAVFSEFIAKQSALVPKLRPPIMLPGCGHWTQQERAPEVSTAMIDFLRSSYARTRTRTSGNDKVVAVLGARLDMRPVEQDFGLRDQRGVSLSFAFFGAALSIDPLRALGSGAASTAPADVVKPQSTVMARVRIMR